VNRTKTVGVIAATAVMIMIPASAQAVAPGHQPASRTIVPQATSDAATITPFSADETISQTTVGADGSKSTTSEHNRFYRDSQGRTRYETGSLVTISDPATKTTLRLDTEHRTFQKTTAPPARPGARGDGASPGATGQITSEQRSLGTTQVDGIAVEGRAYTVTLPATGQLPARTKDVTVWLASALRLTVETVIADSTGQQYRQSYSNISAGKELSADLFTIPTGYRASDGTGTTGAGVNAPCPITNSPDPLILNSYGLSFGSGYINAATDVTLGCFFYGSAWYFEFPLEGWATVPLGLPFDQWFVRDNGCLWCLPYVPWVAFGDVVFSATNLTDVTTKDSFIVLTVWG
jgi:outer membrane lipoprotein-sorting protein